MTKDYERQLRWQKRHPDRYRAQWMRINKQRKENGLLHRWYLKRKYGITPEDWEVLFEKQNRQCAICGIDNSKWHLDHNHKTNEIRGILCHLCNRILMPAIEHYEQLIPKALAYLHS